MASSNMVIIISIRDVLLVRHQATTNKQFEIVVDWAIRNKVQWTLNENAILIQKKAFENMVCKKLANFGHMSQATG